MSSFDSGAFLELEEIYCRLLTARATDYRDVWRLFAGNERYRNELHRAALRLLRERRLTRHLAPDIEHEALVVLGERLRRRNDLGFDSTYGKERFLAWIRAIARLHCRHALRRQRARRRSLPDIDVQWAACHAPTVAWRAELADAIQSLSEAQRAVISAYRQFGSIEAVAEQLALSPSTAWRRFRAAVSCLRRRCRPFVATARLVGVSSVAKKW